MEASQASEAGSIPVARSTTARPRAGRFCYACAGDLHDMKGRYGGDTPCDGFVSCPPADMKGARRLQNLDAPVGAKNFAHRTYKCGQIETSNTTARFPELTNETASTFASPQHPENHHCPRAKVPPVSSQRSHNVAKAPPVSPQRSNALDTEPMHQIAQQCTSN